MVNFDLSNGMLRRYDQVILFLTVSYFHYDAQIHSVNKKRLLVFSSGKKLQITLSEWKVARTIPVGKSQNKHVWCQVAQGQTIGDGSKAVSPPEHT